MTQPPKRPVELFELAFLAPVPFGNDVLVMRFMRRREVFLEMNGPLWVVIDRTTRVLYGDENVWTLAAQSPSFVDDPVKALTIDWRAERVVVGKSAGALVFTRGEGESLIRTRLIVAPSGSEMPGPLR